MRTWDIIERNSRNSAERQAYAEAGRAKLRRIAEEGKNLAPLTPEASRTEVYDYFVQKRRAAAAATDPILGYTTFQYVPFDRLDTAVRARQTMEEYHKKIDTLPGFWNYLARKRVQHDYHVPGPAFTFADCFEEEKLGVRAPAELDYIWEEDQPMGCESLFDHMERIRFVTAWEAFATEHGVPVLESPAHEA